MNRKKTLLMIMLLLFAFCAFSVNLIGVSAVPLSPYIAVVPESTVNSAITPGMYYNVSIYTDYAGYDIWCWQFTLSYNPDVLQIPTFDLGTNDTWINSPRVKVFYTTKAPIVNGTEKVYVNNVLQTSPTQYSMDYGAGRITFVSYPPLGATVKATYTWFGVVNGDLINIQQRGGHDPDPSATYMPGTFNNTLGKLSLTAAFFYYTTTPYTTYGPGTLAKIIFRVVGIGASNITLGKETQLRGWGVGGDYAIIDASKPPGRTEPPYGSDHIGNGYFENIVPGSHDVAVSSLVAPTTAVLGTTVGINVTVRNKGDFAETLDVTVYANTIILVGKQTGVPLARGGKTTLTFNWDTSGIVEGNYIINATAVLPTDGYPLDNTKTAPIQIKKVHDVAIVSLKAPPVGYAGYFVPIEVTVENQGNFPEDVTLTISYEQVAPSLPPKVFNTTIFTLAARPASKIVSVKWNTTGLGLYVNRINATATIVLDEDPSDNIKTQLITLKLIGDVDGDRDVDSGDLGILAAAYGSKSGQASYDVRADFNLDAMVAISDLFDLGKSYAKKV